MKEETMDATNLTIFVLPVVGFLNVILAMLLMALFGFYHSMMPLKYQHECSGKDVLTTAVPFGLVWFITAPTLALTNNLVLGLIAFAVSVPIAGIVLTAIDRRISAELSQLEEV